jgi:hypothetical protein
MSGYIGGDNIDIVTNFASLGNNNTWTRFTQFNNLSTSSIVHTSGTTLDLTNSIIPNNIIITTGNLTLRLPNPPVNGIIVHIRRTVSGTTTLSGNYSDTTNTNMISTALRSISFVGYGDRWYKIM